MTENEALDMLAKFQKRLDEYEDENRQLRTANAILQDEVKLLQRKADIGEATECFFKEIKRIMG